MNTVDIRQDNNINHYMKILTGIAIILVVLGHIDMGILSIGGLFPYYSYHVMIFLFVSGYFYRSSSEDTIGAYIIRKFKHLIIPYYAWALVYGILSTILGRRGFEYCNSLTFHNLVVDPFMGGHAFGLNFAAWFVPALFVIEIINVLGRRILSLIHLDKDILIFVLSLILGIICVYLAQTGHVWGIYKTPGRIIFMMPIYQFGRIYRKYLEPFDNRVKDYIYFPALLIIQVLIYILADGALNFSAVWCTGFASTPVTPYITTITGIALWLRISKRIERIWLGHIIETIGRNSFHVMMHHVLVNFCINCLVYLLATHADYVRNFDIDSFYSNVNYVYLPWGQSAWKLVICILAVTIPVLVAEAIRNIKNRLV